MVTRNDAIEFARRTKKNLQHIEMSLQNGDDVHLGTQLTLSLLGLVVFLREKNFARHINHLKMKDLIQNGWPKWEESITLSNTLGQLTRHLRNAVAHGHLTFSSDSRDIRDVTITVEDFEKSEDTKPCWTAQIQATDLRTFCFLFLERVEESIG